MSLQCCHYCGAEQVGESDICYMCQTPRNASVVPPAPAVSQADTQTPTATIPATGAGGIPPIPWTGDGHWIYDKDGVFIASTSTREDAATIVHRVNAFDEMKKALERIRDHTHADGGNYRDDDREGCLDTVFTIASEALTNAERAQ